MIVLGVLGTDTTARMAMHLVRHSIELASPTIQPGETRAVFVSQHPSVSMLDGKEVVSVEGFLAVEADIKYFNPAIANSSLRQRAAEQMLSADITPLNLADETTLLLPDTHLEPGWILPFYNTVNSNVRIGQYFQAGASTTVSHHNDIGDYVTFGHRVACSGNAIIEDHVTICTGAMVMQGKPDTPTRIGQGAVIHANAVVLGGVEAGAHMVGNPAKPVDPIPLFEGETW